MTAAPALCADWKAGENQAHKDIPIAKGPPASVAVESIKTDGAVTLLVAGIWGSF